MKGKYISTIYVINIVFQAIFTFAMYIGVALLFGWLATSFWGAEGWIYVPLILGGVLLGFLSMIRFILSAMRALDAIEKQNADDLKRMRKRENEKKIDNPENNSP